MTEGSVLEIIDLELEVRAGTDTVEILRKVSLTIGAGESLGLVGQSGSGKSMTARCITRLLPPSAVTRGRILFGGNDVLTLDRTQLRRFRSHDVAMVFQDPRAYINPLQTIGEFLVEGLVTNHGKCRREATATVTALLDDVGVAGAQRRLRQRPYELSGGMLQRVMIAAALAIEPRLLLADEPTTALDVTTQEEVAAILSELRSERGLAMLFITHDLDLASAVCDSLAVMKDGCVVEKLDARDPGRAATHPYTRQLLDARVPFSPKDGVA
ncbi:ABC transporter ATP-binding protein [Rhodococcus sp. IEGM1428]|uniref:ABC transporter ATP-binding protein n=1 Tax=Rhodococcus sp. IEGM1428 TaxID=3392191 RepID=UPI003D14DD29